MFVASLLPFVTGSHDISSFLDLDGKPCLTTCGVMSRGCYGNRKSFLLGLFFLFIDLLSCLFFILFLFFLVYDRPLLEEHYQGRIKAALDFSLTIDDFDKLVDPCCLYECCLGPEPSTYVLKKIAQKEKSRFLIFVLSCFTL